MSTTANISYLKPLNRFTKVRQWLSHFGLHYRNRHMLIIQVLIITITILHILVDRHLIFANISCSDFFPATLFYIPVIYAALRFGFAGSLGVALEATIINAPAIVLFHQGLAILGIGMQFLFVNIGAAVLGHAVDLQKASGRRAKTYATLLTSAHEEERQRIARDLHDESVQAMILLCRALDGADSSSSLPRETMEKLKAARKIAEQEVMTLRNIARNLRPPLLNDLGMVAAIRKLQMDLMERIGANGQLEVLGVERRIGSELELGLFRIAQEAFSNVEHHSRATNLAVTLKFTDKEIRLKVQDNGIGFNQPSPQNSISTSGGLGILGMGERTEILGGKLDIQSSNGKGTMVTIVVPLNSSAQV